MKRLLLLLTLFTASLQAQDTVYCLIYGNTKVTQGWFKADSIYVNTVKGATDSSAVVAPLWKLPTRTLLTTKIPGLLESTGDSLYWTDGAGVRRALAIARLDTTTSSTAGGWTRTNKIYTTTAGDKVHIRSANGDTTASALLNIYGTTSFQSDWLYKAATVFQASDTSIVNANFKGRHYSN
jgi:hypothetical protein